MSNDTILVTRATGSQGIAVCSHLQQNGFKIHALVRDASEDRAIALKRFGATLFEGSLDDKDVITRAATGCTGLFLNLMPDLQKDDSELQQAKTILTSAKAVGVKHVIYTTSLSVGKHEQIDGWDPKAVYGQAILSKLSIEEEVKRGGWESWTIIRPGYFMTNFLSPIGSYMFPELSSDKLFLSSFRPDTVLPLIDPDDIGAFATAAFANPEKFRSQEIEITGEALPVPRVVESLSKAAGISITTKYRDPEETKALLRVNPMISGQIASQSLIKFVDIDQAKSWGVTLHSFDEFLANARDRVKATFGTN